MSSTVHGESKEKKVSLLVSARAASMPYLTAKATLDVRQRGGSPTHLEPKMPSGFGLSFKNVILKSTGISLLVGGLYSQVLLVRV